MNVLFLILGSLMIIAVTLTGGWLVKQSHKTHEHLNFLLSLVHSIHSEREHANFMLLLDNAIFECFTPSHFKKIFKIHKLLKSRLDVLYY